MAGYVEGVARSGDVVCRGVVEPRAIMKPRRRVDGGSACRSGRTLKGNSGEEVIAASRVRVSTRFVDPVGTTVNRRTGESEVALMLVWQILDWFQSANKLQMEKYFLTFMTIF